MKLSTLIEEVVAPHRNFGVAINVALSAGDVAEPVGGRNPAILYGLGNLLENAVDFAHERVEVAASWNGQDVAVTITDDGPGFVPEIMDRIGEPYVTRRRRERQGSDGEVSGLRAGLLHCQDPFGALWGDARLENRCFPTRALSVHWGRSDFERPMALHLNRVSAALTLCGQTFPEPGARFIIDYSLEVIHGHRF